MKILASLTLQADNSVVLPTATPLSIPTAGCRPQPGQHFIQGELVKVAGKLTLLIHNSTPAAGMIEFVQCAGVADASGNIENAGLSCDMSGPFCGALVEIKGRRAYFMAAHSVGTATPSPVKPRKSEKLAPVVEKPAPEPLPAVVESLPVALVPVPEPEPVMPVVVEPANAPEPVAVAPVIEEAPAVVEAVEPPAPLPVFEIVSKPISEPFPIENDPVPGLVAFNSLKKSAPEAKPAPKKAPAIKPPAEVKPVESVPVPVPPVAKPKTENYAVASGTTQLSIPGITDSDVEFY